jgi:signal transduction histidine kinase
VSGRALARDDGHRERPGTASRRLALRARVSVTFAAVSLLLVLVLALSSYFLARTYVVEQRQKLAMRQAFLNAQVANNLLATEGTDPQKVLDALQGEFGTAGIIYVQGRWYASSVAIGPAQIPHDVLALVQSGDAARRRVTIAGTPEIVVGTPMRAVDGQYFEFSPMSEIDRTLRILAGSLTAASAVTVVAGAAVGWYAARRLLRPLERVSDAAVEIAGGRLDTRLDDEGDADLEPLVTSFNEMVAALQLRLEREARLASDVSPELRTPLTALSTAMQVVRARAADMPDRTRMAVDVLESQIRYFERLVLDLLEISRFDAGASDVEADDIDVVALTERVAAAYGGVPVTHDESEPRRVVLDPRRVERILVNLLDNAERHAGGATGIGVACGGGVVRLTVEDHGPGIPEIDRERVFDRFWRGAGSRSTSVKGTGLGLALVAEHVRVLGGRVRVDAGRDGGARFVVELPAPAPASAPTDAVGAPRPPAEPRRDPTTEAASR